MRFLRMAAELVVLGEAIIALPASLLPISSFPSSPRAGADTAALSQQLLRDNLTLWTSDLSEAADEPPKQEESAAPAPTGEEAA